jgi:hypothetical protein
MFFYEPPQESSRSFPSEIPKSNSLAIIGLDSVGAFTRSGDWSDHAVFPQYTYALLAPLAGISINKDSLYLDP